MSAVNLFFHCKRAKKKKVILFILLFGSKSSFGQRWSIIYSRKSMLHNYVVVEVLHTAFSSSNFDKDCGMSCALYIPLHEIVRCIFSNWCQKKIICFQRILWKWFVKFRSSKSNCITSPRKWWELWISLAIIDRMYLYCTWIYILSQLAYKLGAEVTLHVDYPGPYGVGSNWY